MQMQQLKDMINGVTYNVFMHHVMIFQNTDVSTQMASEHSMMTLVLMHVHLLVVLLVSLLHHVMEIWLQLL